MGTWLEILLTTVSDTLVIKSSKQSSSSNDVIMTSRLLAPTDNMNAHAGMLERASTFFDSWDGAENMRSEDGGRSQSRVHVVAD